MIKVRTLFLLIIGLAILLSSQLYGQSDTTLTQNVEDIMIRATRIETNADKVPVAISLYQADEVQSIRQQLSLQEYVAAIPGLFSLNANNYAQDLRISIRGFGAQSSIRYKRY